MNPHFYVSKFWLIQPTLLCKLFPIKQFSTEFQKQLLGLYNISEKETNDEEDEQDDGEFLTQSLDYPSLHQSKKETWKVCRCCRYRTRDQLEFDEHLLLHPRCPDCDTYFVDENSLNKHYKQYHSTVSCDICSEIEIDIQENYIQISNKTVLWYYL